MSDDIKAAATTSSCELFFVHNITDLETLQWLQVKADFTVIFFIVSKKIWRRQLQ